MKKLLALSALLLALTGCSAATRYNVAVNVASLIPEAQRTQSFGSVSSTIIIPGSNEEGLLVPLPALEIVEGGRIVGTVRLVNTGTTPFSGNYEIRMGKSSDSNINDNQNGDFAVGTNAFSVAVGGTQDLNINIQISPTVNPNALQLLQKENGFRIALKVGASGTGGSVTLSAARVSVTARPFAAIK